MLEFKPNLRLFFEGYLFFFFLICEFKTDAPKICIPTSKLDQIIPWLRVSYF